jgi:HEAT repeat protein
MRSIGSQLAGEPGGLFGAACCERLSRPYELFAAETKWGDWNSLTATLERAWASETPTTRAAAANLLGFWHDRRNVRYPPRVEAGLSAQLSDPEAPVREEAAWALSLAPGGTSEAAVVRLTSDGDGRVRAGAFSALGALAGENAELRSLLVQGLRDSHPWARIAALHQLELGAPELANTEAARLISDPDPWVRERAEEVSRRSKRL